MNDWQKYGKEMAQDEKVPKRKGDVKMKAQVVHLRNSYEGLVQEGCGIVEQQENMNWVLGELASYVEKSYGEGKLQQYAEDIGVDYGTLKDCRTTYEAWSDKKAGQPAFYVARVLNPHPDRFKIVAENPKITKRQAQEIMRNWRDNKEDEEKRETLRLVHLHNCASAISMAPCDCSDLTNAITQEMITKTQEVIDTWTRAKAYLLSLGMKE